MDAALALCKLKQHAPATTLVRARRPKPTAETFGRGSADPLAKRGHSAARAERPNAGGAVALLAPFRARQFALTENAINVIGEDGKTQTADEVIVATGFRPDFSGLSEIRLDLHPWLECPRALGPLIDPNEHSCGDV